jgi:cell division protein FtsB
VYGHASVLLAAVQAQQRQIDQLEAQVASLRNRKAVCTAPPGR